jgi:hypothetical protein
VRTQAKDVRPLGEHLPVRAAAGEAEGVPAGQHVPQAREHAEPATVSGPELELEHADGLDHLPVERLVDAPGAEGQHDRRAVRGGELVMGQLDVRDEGSTIRFAPRDRPRNPGGLASLC